MPRFKEMPLDPSQLMLYGRSVEDAVGADCDVGGFADVMNCLDYSEIESKGSDWIGTRMPPGILPGGRLYGCRFVRTDGCRTRISAIGTAADSHPASPRPPRGQTPRPTAASIPEQRP